MATIMIIVYANEGIDMVTRYVEHEIIRNKNIISVTSLNYRYHQPANCACNFPSEITRGVAIKQRENPSQQSPGDSPVLGNELL